MTNEVQVFQAGPEQARAASPDTFVWVSANAGSGKTHVLIDRLARLLLSGTRPSRILCLTFTKAAAAEMSNRLFDRLAGWAMASDAILSDVLVGLTGDVPEQAQLVRARQLFAVALESPGGLKIHTIHAFCTRVLKRFPLEANVAPNFVQADERTTTEILSEIREQLMVEAANEPDGDLAVALAAVSARLHDMNLDDFFKEFLNRRGFFAGAKDPAIVDSIQIALADVFGWQGAPRSEEELIEEAFGAGFARKTARAVGLHLQSGSVRDTDLAPGFLQLAEPGSERQAFEAHSSVFLTQSGILRKNVMTAPLRKLRPELATWIDEEKLRAEDLLRAIGISRTLAASKAAMVLGHRVVTAYEAAKRKKSLLDYDDLILKTRELLSRSQDAEWVLYKLDGGIDHILVDEAQDTSKDQWEIVRQLAEDMVSGASAQDVVRTVFAVGDEKQSIFSFHGADPQMFDEMRAHFQGRVADASLLWDAVPLEASFRSAPEILAAVDAVFAAEAAAAGLSFTGATVRHKATRRAAGVVELWPTAKIDADAPPDPWTVPVDQIAPGDSKLVLAEQIADEIARWLKVGRQLTPQGRPVRPGDIMILVRRRNAFVDAMVRTLKVRDIPVAGVDRMRLTEQIAVEDLIALGRFAALPEDDLNTAVLLKSPFFDISEEDLFELAWGRETSLWRSLQDICAGCEDEEAKVGNKASPVDESCVTARSNFSEARRVLASVLASADWQRPFEFFSNFLAVAGKREAIHKRLGVEADDPINEFLAAALSYEQNEIATLDGFLAWLCRSEMEIKRDMEHGKDEVRVMTVHGAKGLEANLVILPDTCAESSSGNRFQFHDVGLANSDIKLPVWPQAKPGIIPAIDEAKAHAKLKDAEEYRRLLYVAMTRARDCLIVTGYEAKGRKPPAGCWYNLVAEGLDAHFPNDGEDIGNGRKRFVLPGKDSETAAENVTPGGEDKTADGEKPGIGMSQAREELPQWALTLPDEILSSGHLKPSSLVDGEDSIGVDESAPASFSPLAQSREQRFLRGNLIHGLLETLPQLDRTDWSKAATNYLGLHAANLETDVRQELAEEAVDVLTSPDFAPFLDPNARAEVPFSAAIELPDGGSVVVDGQVDRLVIIGTTLHVVDFKTHRPAAMALDDIPRGILRQMALYRAALGQIFPAETVNMSLLWTNQARIMALPSGMLDKALAESLGKVLQTVPSP